MLHITVISDYVCPYCLVALELLNKALAITGLEAEINHLPFELSPEGRPQVDTWNDPVRRSHYKVLDKACGQLDLPMKLPPHVIPRPRTRLAYEGSLYAAAYGKQDAWDDRMYRAYFLEEKNIGDPDVLITEAAAIGLDPEDFALALCSGANTEVLQEKENQVLEQYEIKGVPVLVIEGKTVQLDDYSLKSMIALLQGYVPKQDGPSFFCGPNGCGEPEV